MLDTILYTIIENGNLENYWRTIYEAGKINGL